MNNHRQIQIPFDVFLNCFKLIVCECDDVNLLENTKNALEDKMEQITKHDLYTRYKTGVAPEEKEKARLEYLDHIGLHEDWRY